VFASTNRFGMHLHGNACFAVAVLAGGILLECTVVDEESYRSLLAKMRETQNILQSLPIDILYRR
jgi:hypothetical protein